MIPFHNNIVSGLPGDPGRDGEKGPIGACGLGGWPGDMGKPGNGLPNCVTVKRRSWFISEKKLFIHAIR